MSRTHEQSSSQRDHRGESSQEEVQQGVAPMDVVRQQAQRYQEASQRKAPSLWELTLKNFKQLKLEHFQHFQQNFKDKVEHNFLQEELEEGTSETKHDFLHTELADRIFETKEWEAWLDKHFVEFFNTPVGSEWFKEHGPKWLCNTYLHKFKEKENVDYYTIKSYKEGIKKIFNTEAWKDFIHSEKGIEHLDCSGYQMFHGSRHLIKKFVNAPTNKEWIKSNVEKHFTANYDSWLINGFNRYICSSDVWKKLVGSDKFHQWTNTPSGSRKFLDIVYRDYILELLRNRYL